MFDDSIWRYARTDSQLAKLDDWLEESDKSELTIIECGAGKAIPTIRFFGDMMKKQGATLVRINVRESNGRSGTISIELGARDALRQINQTLR